MKLRDYQERAVVDVRKSIASGHRRPILVLPTGAGKSILFGKIISLAVANGKKCLFLVHRRGLVMQFRKTLEEKFFIGAGVIMSGVEFESGLDVYCSTIQTYSRRLNLDALDRNKFFIDADLTLVDEGHTSVSKTFQKVLSLYSDKIIIGCTATPVRADGRGLGEVYDDLIDVAGTKRLTDEGYLSPIRYFVPAKIDLAKIKIQMGDYSKKELAEKVDRPKIVGDIVDSWLKSAYGRRTLVFAVNVAHSIHLAKEFNHGGVSALHLDAMSSDEERNAAFEKMESGEVTVICNNLLYVEGMDVPNIECIVMARPTKNIGLWRQAIGRGLRLAPGKDNLIVLDHGGCVEEHGLVTDDIEWSLDGDVKGWAKKKKKKEKKLTKCRACHEVFEGANVCPVCGTEVKSFGRDVEAVDGELKEIDPKKVGKASSIVDKRRFLGMLKYYVAKNGKNPKMVNGAYRGKFGVWPAGSVKHVAPIEPDSGFESYMLHQRIKYAKRMEKKNAG